ncbi:MAG TPA: hypothetical protein VH370_13260 [Humisphaera sp.]|jgi:predicted Zn-ribbon and HTH transcriptional regulator|nr:hypothetical protein [Humisphaera sp.]
MYWLIDQFPELDHLEPAQRAQLLAQLPRWTYPMIVARAGAGGVLLCTGIAMLFGRRCDLMTLAIVCTTASVVTACAVYVSELSQLRKAMRKAIADGFQTERPPFCFECGYDLRQASDTLCPECGVDWRASRAE